MPTAASRFPDTDTSPPCLAFVSYGSFWMAYSTFLIPAFGVQTAYAGHHSQLTDATGIFLAPWFIITLIFL